VRSPFCETGILSLSSCSGLCPGDQRLLCVPAKTRGKLALKALRSLLIEVYPVLTVKRLASLLGITVPAASLAVDQLVESKILQERTGYTRNRVFAAPHALSIINRPFGEDPIVPDPAT
jgi:hypothetical protein